MAILTISQLIAEKAKSIGDQQALIYLPQGEEESERLTYAELDQRARQIAAHLKEHGLIGERVLLLQPPGIGYVTAFLGCIYAGVIAIPTYPPRKNRHSLRLANIVADAQARAILTIESSVEQIKSYFSDEGISLDIIATDICNQLPLSDWINDSITKQSLAYLQYTSGSTGTPKGVMVHHQHVIHNCAIYSDAVELEEYQYCVSWLPLFHDMGLVQGIMLPLFRNGTAVFMQPATFIQKPIRWLRAISDYRARMSGCPNFGYNLCVQKITSEQCDGLDLSTWQVATNGAEPVLPATLDEFTTAFSSYGFTPDAFNPSYGMAEATLFVSCGRPTEKPMIIHIDKESLGQNKIVLCKANDPNAYSIVGCGLIRRDPIIRIVNPDSRTCCSTGQVGEIWIAGESVCSGYWQREAESDETFAAKLSEDPEHQFLRTGDLGFIFDGQLFITGRLKDILIIRGANHYPQDIENTVEKLHPALKVGGWGAAFSVIEEGEERLVIAQEVERSHRHNFNADELVEIIRQEIADVHGLDVYAIVFLKPGGLPKTSSGKIQHKSCREAFLSNTLPSLAQWRQTEPIYKRARQAWRHSSQIEAWLCRTLSTRLNIATESVDVTAPLASFGLSSVRIVELSGELAEWLGKDISPTLLYDYPSIEAISQHLAGKKVKQHSSVTVTDASKPIAIVGMACRFPGGINGTEAFWELLQQAHHVITEVPKSRWDIDLFYDSNLPPGKMNTRWGGFLDEIDLFDANLFRITRREAESMDPQQRLLLEVVWEAIEHANIPIDALKGTLTGVFVGMSTQDYGNLQRVHGEGWDSYSGTGNAFSIAANRLSYVFDLRGPSMTIDTACSSSLVAIHQACRSIAAGDCNTALVAGVNLILTPNNSVVFSQAQMMSPTGFCRTFDEAADGYVRGEGCAAIVLKTLSEAQKQGDTILSVIKGSAINQDGQSNGLTAPNGLAQQKVIRAALADANVPAHRIGYVETHGTGTPLGDPIEVQALQKVLVDGRAEDKVCWLGAVKTNFGHLEAAAGIAGFIKTVLVLQKQKIPANLHLQHLNPRIDLQATPLKIPVTMQAWPNDGGSRLAAVSSFGFGGTNAHIILEEAAVQNSHKVGADRPRHLLPLSAKNETALDALVRRYQSYFATQNTADIHDICYTAGVGRTHYACRLALIGKDEAELKQQVDNYLNNATPLSTTQANQSVPKVCFLFTGQGSQYSGMGKLLYKTQPFFKANLDQCSEILKPLLDKPLLSLLWGDDTDYLNDTKYTQPVLFALEYSLAKLWQSWGIVPDAVMGHSVGEYVAACIAGVFCLEDGLKLIAARGRLMQTLCEKGDMLVLSVNETKTAELIEPFTAEVSIAAINGPENVVISGKHETIESIRAILSDKENIKIKITRLQVSHAFHSPMMEPMLAEFKRVVAEVVYAAPQIPLCSNVTGQLATDEIATPAYWVRHVRQPVRFAASMETLYQQGYECFMEIGPKPSLLGMGRLCLPDDVGTWLVSLRQGQDDWQQLLQSLGELYVRGVSIDWAEFDQDLQQSKVPLPTYPFQRQRYWCCDRQPNWMVPASALKPEYSLLGQSLDLAASDSIYFEHYLGPNNPAYLADHCIQGITILPAAAYVEMALAAATQSFQNNSWVLEAVSFHRPLVLTQKTRVQTLLRTLSNQPGYQFEIWSEARDREEQRKWLRHASGTIKSGKNLPDKEEITGNEAESTSIIAPATHYAECQRLGYEYGPVFQALKALEIRGNIATAQVSLPPNIIAETNQIIHPALLDASIQILVALLPKEILTNKVRLLLPAGIQQFNLMAKVPSQLTVTAQLLPIEKEYCANFTLCALDGTTVAAIKRLTLKPATMKTISMVDDAYASFFYHPIWVQSLSNSAHSQAQKIMIIYAEESVSLAKLMAACLTDKQVIYLTIGEENKQLSENQWQIKAADKQGFDAVLKTQQGIDHIYFLGGFHLAQAHKDLDLSTLNNLQEQGVISLLQLIKSLDTCYISQNKIGPNGLALKVITNRTSPVYAAEPVVPWGGSLFGITEVCSKEFIEINSINIDIDWSDSKSEEDLQESVRALLEEPALDCGGRVAFRNGNRYTQKFEPMLLPTAESKAVPVRENGVYLILGGAGGIGFVFSHYLVEKYKARIIWIGRSELSEDKQQEIKKLQEKGGKIRYFQMDGTDLSGMQQVVNTVNEEWGAIQGVVHSALVLHDQSLSTMEEDSFRQVLAPKIQASWVLSQVTKRQPLDFMLFFSSAQSFVCSPGQSNYASGCTFKDAFAHYLKINHSVPVKIINWGYWGSVGVVSSDEYTRRLEAQGIQSIEPQEGLEAIERILSLPVTQMIAIKASKENLQGMGVYFESQATWISARVAAPLNQIDQTQWPINLSVSASELSESYHALNQWASLLTLRAFQEMGLEQLTKQAFSTEELKSTLQLMPGYDGLYHACLAMLEVAGFIKIDKHSLLVDVDNAALKQQPKTWLLEQKDVLEKNYPWLIATIHLLWETGHRLPQILRGKVAATEVLFSDSAMELVEQFYLQEPLSIYTNQQIAYLVLDLVKSIKRVNKNQEKIRILELGAGTGSTSRLVLALLPVSDNIEYRYTDISPFFIQRGTELFGDTYPFVTFDTLDIEQSPQQKGYQAGSYDIIFAANVLHATTNISQTLQNVKYLLKSGGALILNELTQKQNFITLTFGLLDGWWLAQDKEKRIPHSPLLSTKQWSVALQDEAFENPLILDAPPLKKAYYSQHVILAQSNGKIRMPVQPQIASSEPITTQQGVLDGAAEKSSLTPSRQDLVAASRETALRELQDYMQRIVAQVMRMQTTELNTPNQPFLQRSLNEFGLDSLMAMDLRNSLRKDMNVEIEIQTFIGGTKVEEIIDLIHQQLLLQQINLNETQEQETEGAADQDRETLSL